MGGIKPCKFIALNIMKQDINQHVMFSA
uniref:Uncharacterized protein n=1 Tax=Rhizophora mucronata TaxID=61149 RepID=A0A2P2NUH4_RHIMU